MELVGQQQHQHQPVKSSLPSTPRKTVITVGLDENLNPNPESVSMRAQFRAQIVATFSQHLATLKYINGTFSKPLKTSLTAAQHESLFGNLKHLRALYVKLNRTITNSQSSDNLEKCLKDIFTGKLGKAMELLFIQYTLNHRAKVSSLLSILEDSSKLTTLTESHQKSESQWSSQSLDDLLDSITLFCAAYPLHLDRLLQETPIQSEQYQILEQTLVCSRNIAKMVADAKDGLLSGEEFTKKANYGGRFHTMLARMCGHV